MNRLGRQRIATASHGLAEAVVIGMVVLTPWLLGGVRPEVQAWLQVAALAGLVLWGLGRVLYTSPNPGLPTAILPLLAALVLGAAQLVPLDAKTLALLSPAAAELRQSLEDARPSTESYGEATGQSQDAWKPALQAPLTLYPCATRRDLALMILGTTVFFLGTRLFHGYQSLRLFLGLVAVNGAVIGFFGLIQKLTWNGKIYWTFPLHLGGGPFGPFVNQNNAGGYLNLCLAAALGLLVLLQKRSLFDPDILSLQWNKTAHTRVPLEQSLRRFVAAMDGKNLTVLISAGCIAASVLCCLSRGAFLAMIGAVFVTILVLLGTRRLVLHLWPYFLMGLLALSLVAWAGMTQAVQDRLATLLDKKTVEEHSLIPLWQDNIETAKDYWRTGSGWGTYRFVYSLYQENRGSLTPFFCYHAENQYLESLVVGGILGVAMELLMILLIGLASWRLLCSRHSLFGPAAGVVGTFALVSQCICSSVDFGLYIPANVLLFALLCGVISGRAADGSLRERWERVLVLPHFRGFSFVVGIGLLAAGLWGGRELRLAGAIDRILRYSPPADSVGGFSTFEDKISQLTEAVEGCPDDSESHLVLAKEWILLYRARDIDQIFREEPSEGKEMEQAELAAAASEPIVLHARVHRLIQQQDTESLRQLRRDPLVRDCLLPAIEHLALARRGCPLLPEVHLLMAELSGLVEGPPSDWIHIDHVRRLAGADDVLHFQCGMLEYQAGRLDLAYADWKRTLTLNPAHLDGIVATIGRGLEQPGTVAKLFPDSPAFLLEMRRRYGARREDAAIQAEFLQRAEELLDQTPLPDAEHEYLQGEIDSLRGRDEQAINHLAWAVERQPKEVAWRFALATLLKKRNRLDEAREHVKLCVLLSSKNLAYRKLHEEIIREQLLTTRPSPR